LSKLTDILNSAEIANLWTQYINDSMALCVNTYMLETSTENDIKAIFKKTLRLSSEHITKIKHFLSAENYPVPLGFTEDDVKPEAPSLFTDAQKLVYLQIMTLHGLNSYSLCLTTSVRTDQRKYYRECLEETSELYEQVLEMMLDKGLFSLPPKIQQPEGVSFVKEQSYMSGWMGKKRPLNGIEISGIFYNMQKTVVKMFLEIGFSQVAEKKDILDYFQRGTKVCESQLQQMAKVLTKEHLATPKRWQSDVTHSTEAPFSDKLMLFHIVSLISVSIGYYGVALSHSQRRDLILMYTKLIAEMGLYGEDGMSLLIKYGWMEQPPATVDREKLVND
jgi:hypothetical protein